MKGKIVKILALCAVPVVAFSLAGCSVKMGENSGYILYDTEVYPSQAAPYEEQSKAVISDYLEVANKHIGSDGYVAYDNTDVQAAAQSAAAQLYAYACYNEEYLDKYVYFSDQEGTTTVGSGTSKATKQDYKLIIHESDDTCGYKYHYTIKEVDKATGTLSLLESAFESCRLRFVINTNVLYRFDGDDVHYDDDGYLTCTWEKGSVWGSSEDEPSIVKREGDLLTIDGIADDIVSVANSDPSNAIIHGNVNILADGMISYAIILESEIGTSGLTGYTVIMVMDTDVANSDSASLSMLRESNSSDNCRWNDNEFTIAFQIWDNGLFYMYNISETWNGDISGFSGEVESTTKVTYSYSDDDTDITEKLKLLEGEY